jgi:hypothetical protein
MSTKIKTIIAVYTLLAVLLLFAGAAQADVAVSNPLYAWDKNVQIFKSSDAILRWDNSYLPFLTELSFDPQPYFPAACPESGSRWSGELTFSLYHVDNDPYLAQGFQSTRNWRLVDCDRNGDGLFDSSDLSAQPPEGFSTLMTLTPQAVDVHVPCTSQHCQEEIVTTVEINLDGNCDGLRDPMYPAHVCFYSEARSPQAGLDPYWRGYIQAQVSTPGNTQVVNFIIQNPTAVSVTKFGATSAATSKGSLALSLVMIVGAIPFGWQMVRRKS